MIKTDTDVVIIVISRGDLIEISSKTLVMSAVLVEVK